MSIKVLKPGLATSVQDAGREGHYHLGIPPSGALDQYALRAANLLVGNAPTAAVLECALLGPQLEFQRDALVAVCGARMTPRLEGAEMPLDTSFRVRAVSERASHLAGGHPVVRQQLGQGAGLL
ncbi:hypothetical protein MU752_07940, partial [Pseudomonas aeruginosa]|nr:hypothetical protein [Pseudomonas aeruginosa]